jgi:hypothetical protein
MSVLFGTQNAPSQCHLTSHYFNSTNINFYVHKLFWNIYLVSFFLFSGAFFYSFFYTKISFFIKNNHFKNIASVFYRFKKKSKNGKKTIKNKKLLKVIYQIVIDFSEKRENMCSFVIKKKNIFTYCIQTS